VIISYSNKFIFVSNPKTGTHTLYDYLCDKYEGVQLEGPYHRFNLPDVAIEDYFVFSTCRNPVDRLVSIYHALIERDNYRNIYLPLVGDDSFLSFCDWITSVSFESVKTGKGRILLKRQFEYFDNIPLNKLIKIENLNDQFSNLPFVNDDTVLIPPKLQRSHSSWDELKSNKISNILRDWLKPDYEFCGYDIEQDLNFD
jgi:hypothetical protein